MSYVISIKSLTINNVDTLKRVSVINMTWFCLFLAGIFDHISVIVDIVDKMSSIHLSKINTKPVFGIIDDQVVSFRISLLVLKHLKHNWTTALARLSQIYQFQTCLTSNFTSTHHTSSCHWIKLMLQVLNYIFTGSNNII